MGTDVKVALTFLKTRRNTGTTLRVSFSVFDTYRTVVYQWFDLKSIILSATNNSNEVVCTKNNHVLKCMTLSFHVWLVKGILNYNLL